MKNIITIILIMILPPLFTQCSKEDDLMDKFPPEVLYKQQILNTDNKLVWEVSPNVKQITLEEGITDWTVRARVSAPSQLAEITLKMVDDLGSERVLQKYSDFVKNPNVYHVEYPLSDITKTTVVSIEAYDKRGLLTKRNFTINVKK